MNDELHQNREILLKQAEIAAEKQHKRGKLSAWERITGLLDKGSFIELNPYIEHRAVALGMSERKRYGDGVVTGYGEIDGRRVFVFSQDFTFMGGSLGEMHARKICNILDLALENGVPVIGFHDSGGARIQEGVSSLAGYGEIFKRNVAASGVIPQIAVIAGPTAGGASYSPALMDFIFMVENISYTFITGPRVIKKVTGEDVESTTLGGPKTHASITGTSHLTLNSEKDVFIVIRKLLSYLPSNNLDDAPRYITVEPRRNIEGIIPKDSRKPYDVKRLIESVFDGDSFFELQPEYARNAVIGFARLDGFTLGVVATQPLVMAGCMTLDSSDKISRFVRFCDAFNLPILTFQDVPGYLPGLDQEHGGIIRHGAKVIYAYAEATVPKITIILRKSYGGSYIALGSKHLGADFVYALPDAEIAVMGAEGAIEIVWRKQISENLQSREELINKYREEFANPQQAAKLGYIDDIIMISEIRSKLSSVLHLLSKKRVKPSTPKKHGVMPV